jgi:6-pyruvoyltetrahydropterin/6-carboxytetrahydropterin synthase
MPFDITATRTFSAAHAIRLYDGTLEPVHGHNWQVTVTVSTPTLDSIGVVMDFHDLQRALSAIVTPWHNHHLNDIDLFKTPGEGLNPTAEHVALVIAQQLKDAMPSGVMLTKVEVVEAVGCVAIWRA